MEDWARVLQTGDSHTWEDFINRYSGLVYKVFYNKSFGFSREDVEDNFNEFFHGLIKDNFRKIALFEGRNNCSFPTYLKKIALNQAIDYNKRRIKKWMVSLNQTWSGKNQEEGQELGDRVALPEKVPMENLLSQEQREMFCNALYQLRPKQMLIVVMIAYHNFDRIELGKLVDATRANIDVIYNRTKEKMRELVGRTAERAEGDPSWKKAIETLTEKLLVDDRQRVLERCLAKLTPPEQLLVGLVFLDALSLHPTPKRLARLLKCKAEETQSVVEKLLKKVVSSN